MGRPAFRYRVVRREPEENGRVVLIHEERAVVRGLLTSMGDEDANVSVAEEVRDRTVWGGWRQISSTPGDEWMLAEDNAAQNAAEAAEEKRLAKFYGGDSDAVAVLERDLRDAGRKW